jgi:predicted ATPase/DNA-binding XRE family transcriptional regulator
MHNMGTSSFSTFGDLLKYLRRRAQLTQRELAIAVGYTEGHISRLEKNQRPPDLATVAALFIPALMLEEESETAAQLIELAASAHGQESPAGKSFTLSRTQEIREVSEREESIPSNLPIQLTTFIGRQNEIRELTELLSGNSPRRLVTLTGPGGMGKTRLALQTAIGLSHLYLDGIWFVDLTPLTTPDLVSQTVASALSVPEKSGHSAEQTLIEYLRSKQILIVIDNCEHMISAAAQFTEKLLRSCAHVRILATSREPLQVPGEVNCRVPPLSLPENTEPVSRNLMKHEAAQLFIERATNIEPTFKVTDANAPIIARICKQLDGMPLAIELAAARIQVLSLSQIEARLSDRLHLLTSGQTTLPRHQTLRATIEWSHEMLSEAEKALFRRLSVFSGGWTLDAANSVCADPDSDVLDTLAQLVNKSLVVIERGPDTEVRYSMLETIREFAREQLRAADELDSVRARHFEHFLQLAQQGEATLFAAESSVDWAETEISNLRAALAWALEKDVGGHASEERAGRALELMLHIWPLWLSRGYSIEGNEWLNQLLSVHTRATPARARGLLLAGDLAGFRGDVEKKAEFAQESLDLAQMIGDDKLIGWSLMEIGLVTRDHRYTEAVQFLSESLTRFQELKDHLWICRICFLLAETHTMNRNLDAARPLLEQGLELSRAESDKWQMAWGLEGLGNVERLQGNFEQAQQLYTESLTLKTSVMDKTGIAYSLAAFAQLAAAQKHFKRAAILWGAAERLGQTLNLVLIPSREGPEKAAFLETRAQFGEEPFEAAWNQGQAMKLQEVIDYALTQAISQRT